MATNSAGNFGRQLGIQAIHYLRRDFSFADTGVLTVGYLPPGAIVVSAGVIVSTSFNAAGNDFLDLGTSDDPDGWATDLTLATVGNIVWDEFATSDDLYSATARTVVMEYAYTSTAPTTGVGHVYVGFIPDNDQ